MEHPDRLVALAAELQAIAQTGLTYVRDPFDRERYVRIRQIAAELMAEKSGLPTDTVQGLFCADSGYPTPKVDTRAAVFRGGRVLLVREKNGTWSLPGGWCEQSLSAAENAAKETLEESGLTVTVDRLVAVQDRNRHNRPPYAYGVIKLFFSCTATGGAFTENAETTESRWFLPDELPAPLAEEKATREQILLCFSAHGAAHWEAVFD